MFEKNEFSKISKRRRANPGYSVTVKVREIQVKDLTEIRDREENVYTIKNEHKKGKEHIGTHYFGQC